MTSKKAIFLLMKCDQTHHYKVSEPPRETKVNHEIHTKKERILNQTGTFGQHCNRTLSFSP